MKLTVCERLLLAVLRLPVFNRFSNFLFSGIDMEIEAIESELDHYHAQTIRNHAHLIQERERLLAL